MTSAIERLAAAPCLDTKWVKEGETNHRSPYYCPTCAGSGALVPLRRECSHYLCHDKTCQARGWGLVPEAEQMGVLVRAFVNGKFIHLLGETVAGYWAVNIDLYDEYGHSIPTDFVADTPEEALAAALCQALGVE